MHDHAVGRAAVANPPGQPARVDAGDARQLVAQQPRPQMRRGAPVGRLGDVGAHDQAARRRRHGLDVLGVGADVADVREREGDDLPGVGRIGQDLLIAGDRGVEANFADRADGGAEAASPEHRAVAENQRAGGGTGRQGRWRRHAVSSPGGRAATAPRGRAPRRRNAAFPPGIAGCGVVYGKAIRGSSLSDSAFVSIHTVRPPAVGPACCEPA